MTTTPEEAGRLPDSGVWLEALREASAAVAGDTTFEAAAATVVERVCRAAHWPVGRLLWARPGGLEPSGVWWAADDRRLGALAKAMPSGALGATAAQAAASSGRTVWSGTGDGSGAVDAPAASAGLGATVAVPVDDGAGVVAVAEFVCDEARPPGPEVLDMATAAVRQLSLVAYRLRAAEASYDALRMAEEAHDAFIALDGEGRVVEWNPEAEAVFGWSRTEAVGRPVAELAVPVHQRQAFGLVLRRLLDGHQGPLVARRELTAAHRSGEDLPVEVTMWVNSSANGANGSRRICGFVTDLRERKRFEGQLASQALHDRLTGLPNRVLLRDRIEHALARAARSSSAVALFIADVDGFKVVNESLGHDSGDRLLVAAAGRLSEVLRPGDTVARMGGDEFALLCEDVAGRDGAVGIATRILEAFEKPFRVRDTDLSVTASVGVALGVPPGPDPEVLLRDADVAMYRAKESGRDRYEVFDESMLASAGGRLTVENDLKRAIGEGELRLYYQPIVRIDSGAIAGFEALVRWLHPDRGLLAPSAFISAAEQSGLIVPLGRQVLAEACMEAARWRAGPGEPLRVSVNVSARQLSQPGWSDEVAQVLAESGLQPRQLVLEITESVLMDDTEATAVRLEELRRLGVRIAIDDFGTGYSSLGYLRRLPVDILKIDKSFIDGVAEGPHESALARAVVKLASTMRLEAVAEGVGSRKQLNQLRRLRCAYGQGYFFSRPQPPSSIPGLLRLGSLAGDDSPE